MESFRHKFERTHHAKQILDQYESMSKEELQEKNISVSIAGRLVAETETRKGFLCPSPGYERPDSDLCPAGPGGGRAI